MLNHFVCMGRLTRDPELRRTAAGIPVVSFSLACDRDYANAKNERETDFLDCTAWRGTAEFVSKYFRKGNMAVVSGRIRSDKWIDSNTDTRRTRYSVDVDSIYFGGSKPSAPIHENPELPPIPSDDPLPLPEEYAYAGQ